MSAGADGGIRATGYGDSDSGCDGRRETGYRGAPPGDSFDATDSQMARQEAITI
jgi:hypothetical protein